MFGALILLPAASPNLPAQPVEIVSALGPEIEQEALQAVLEARQVYAELGLGLRKPYLPTVIVLLPTVVELSPYLGAAAGRSRAFSFAGADRNYILAGWDAPGSPLRAVAHEYAHLVDPLSDAPVWFREGLAEYLSYFERDASGRLAAVTPATHLIRLRDAPWLSLAELREATRSSPAFQAPTFYAQAWLIAHWLVSQGKAPRALRPDDLAAALAYLGDAGIEAELRRHLGSLAAGVLEEVLRPWPTPRDAPGPDWEVRLALAEVERELGRRESARTALERLQAERPDEPSVAAARGALAMDAGVYDQAEPLLERAAEDPKAAARTRHRLALLLLRPTAGRTRERAQEAARQARLALGEFPGSPDYRLTLAQALMVDEAWEAAARELNALAADPAWRHRAEEELEELVRRRHQALAQAERPNLGPEAAAPLAGQPALEVAAVPLPPKQPPPGPMRWPPPGASIIGGRIDYVDCSGPDKIIVMRHPLLRLRFRERKGKPAKLFLAPLKDWTEIPCGSKGWNVNIAYYEARNQDGVTGEAVAILF